MPRWRVANAVASEIDLKTHVVASASALVRAWKRHPAILVATATLGLLTVGVWNWPLQWLTVEAARYPEHPARLVFSFGCLALGWVLTSFTWGWYQAVALVLHGKILDGAPLTWTDLRRARPLAWIAVWTIAAEGLAALGGALVSLPFAVLNAWRPDLGWVWGALSSCTFIGGYTWLHVRWLFATRRMVFVGEDLLDAPRASWGMTRGRSPELALFIISLRIGQAMAVILVIAVLALALRLLPSVDAAGVALALGSVWGVVVHQAAEVALTSLFLRMWESEGACSPVDETPGAGSSLEQATPQTSP